MKQIIYKLGSEPKVSLKRFFIGLGLFILAATLIGYGYIGHHLFQLVGLILLPFALFFAIYGYLGIFANRFAQVINNINPDDQDHR
jgi:uncharacterized membrane protein YccC